ncbi:MAG: 50S ribosomal protein L15 [Nitrospiria bacterium]
MKMSDLAPAKGAKKKAKRIGRGPASGHGKTATKGHKGQAARSGGTKPSWFEGGQQPLTRRVPKRGFKNLFRKEVKILSLDRFNRFDADAVVTPQILQENGMIKKSSQIVKVLSDGELKKPMVISAHRFSRKAVEKIEAAGGKAEVLS